MVDKTLFLPDGMRRYIASTWMREPDVLRRLREETATFDRAAMQIGADQGQWMMLLTKMLRAKRILEIGVFTGYSSICFAMGMPEDGYILACDVSDEFTSIARRYWKEAEVDHKIELVLAPAIETLDARIAAGETGTYDLMFIDADKTNYLGYYERGLALLRPGGVILVDNVFWDGTVCDDAGEDADLQAIQELNRRMGSDERIDVAILSIGDGLTIACKR